MFGNYAIITLWLLGLMLLFTSVPLMAVIPWSLLTGFTGGEAIGRIINDIKDRR